MPFGGDNAFLQVNLAGRTDQARDDVVVYDEYGPVRMIRTPQWKYVHRHPYGPHELYDLVRDGGERKNLIDEKGLQATVEELRRRLAAWFARYVVPEMDGARFGVTGGGQKHRITSDRCGEEAFFPRDF